jgi:hypothetical protein
VNDAPAATSSQVTSPLCWRAIRRPIATEAGAWDEAVVEANEALKDPLAVGERNARPAVGYLHLDLCSVGAGAHLDMSAPLHAGQGVVEQVADHATESVRVAAYTRLLHVEDDRRSGGVPPSFLHRGSGELGDVNGLVRQMVTPFEACEAEQIVDQPSEV